MKWCKSSTASFRYRHLLKLLVLFLALFRFRGTDLSVDSLPKWSIDVILQAGKSSAVLQAFKVENDIETVVRVLQPGPLGIIEHKFSAEEIRNASATVEKAVANWRRAAILEQRNGALKNYIES